MSFQLLLNGIFSGSLTALLGTGFFVQYSAVRFFIFTYGAAYSCGAYALLISSSVLPQWASVMLGALVATILGASLEYMLFGPLYRRGESALVLMLISIGSYTFLQNLLSVIFGDVTRSVRPWATAPGYLIGSGRVTGLQIVTMLTSLAAIGATALVVHRTSLGKRLRAVADNRSLAEIIGIDVPQISSYASALGSGLAGLAGTLAGLDTGMNPTMGFSAFLLAVVASIAGGRRGIVGVALAGLTIGVIQQLAIWKLQAQWQDAVTYTILFLLILLRPLRPQSGAA